MHEEGDQSEQAQGHRGQQPPQRTSDGQRHRGRGQEHPHARTGASGGTRRDPRRSVCRPGVGVAHCLGRRHCHLPTARHAMPLGMSIPTVKPTAERGDARRVDSRRGGCQEEQQYGGTRAHGGSEALSVLRQLELWTPFESGSLHEFSYNQRRFAFAISVKLFRK